MPAEGDAVDAVNVGTWLKLFGPDDISAMVGIGIIAVFLHRAKAINEQVALLLPIAIGLGVGFLEAWGAAYAPAAFIIKGIMLGGGSGVIGRLVSVALDKMGIFPNSNPVPVCPPTPTDGTP